MSSPDALRVLVVDDDDADIALIREALDGHRVPSQVHIARDGVEALQYLQSGVPAGPRPDMILLDLNMPRMDGREVLAAVKQDPGLADIPVVVFTTSGQPGDTAASYSRHANAYVTKPHVTALAGPGLTPDAPSSDSVPWLRAGWRPAGTMAARIATAGLSVYGSSKAALESLTQTFAAEFASGGVRVNTVAPGPTGSETVVGFMGERCRSRTC